MNVEVIGVGVAVVGALLWIRRDMRHDIAELRRDLSAQMAAMNTRIDNTARRTASLILLGPKPGSEPGSHRQPANPPL